MRARPKTSPPRGPLLVLACVLLLVAGGCTARQSHEQYEQRLGEALEVRGRAQQQLAAKQLGDADALQQAAAEVDAAIEELDADPPPRDVEEAHERMVAGLEGLSSLLSRQARCSALEGRSEADARSCRRSISQEDFDDVRNDFEEANTIYRKKGFSLPEPGGGERAGDGSDANPRGGDEL